MPEPQRATDLLRRMKTGDKAVLDQLISLVYGELHRMASRCLRSECHKTTLETTALVHEAYLRLVGTSQLDCESLSHFYGIAARVMRQILVDHARQRRTGKRGGSAKRVPIDQALADAAVDPRTTIALDDALQALEKIDPGKARLVELRFFAGLTAEESATLLGLSVEAVRHRLKVAQAWLRREVARAEKS